MTLIFSVGEFACFIVDMFGPAHPVNANASNLMANVLVLLVIILPLCPLYGESSHASL